jgi:hypothetical protein
MNRVCSTHELGEKYKIMAGKTEGKDLHGRRRQCWMILTGIRRNMDKCYLGASDGNGTS